MQKFIAHIDLDCFFVSVERIKDSSLRNRPVVVGGSATGRGVVASASYEARRYGIRSAMPTAQALRLCSHLIVVGGHHEEYSRHSNVLYKRMREIAPLVERASIDEMYMDFTGCEGLYENDLPGYMKKLQEMVKEEFQLPCTIALASNKLVAKIAANTVKPAGVIFVPSGSEKEFLSPLPIAALPGVGRKTEVFLKRKGVNTIGDLQSHSLRELVKLLGANGEWLHYASLGIGSTNVEEHHATKSISREETFAHDIVETIKLERILFSLVEDVCSTLRGQCLLAKTVTLKLRTSRFETITRSRSVEATNYDPAIFGIAKDLFVRAHKANIPVRLLGVGLSNLVRETAVQPGLFIQDGKRDTMLKAIDNIRKKYGEKVIDIGHA